MILINFCYIKKAPKLIKQNHILLDLPTDIASATQCNIMYIPNLQVCKHQVWRKSCLFLYFLSCLFLLPSIFMLFNSLHSTISLPSPSSSANSERREEENYAEASKYVAFISFFFCIFYIIHQCFNDPHFILAWWSFFISLQKNHISICLMCKDRFLLVIMLFYDVVLE